VTSLYPIWALFILHYTLSIHPFNIRFSYVKHWSIFVIFAVKMFHWQPKPHLLVHLLELLQWEAGNQLLSTDDAAVSILESNSHHQSGIYDARCQSINEVCCFHMSCCQPSGRLPVTSSWSCSRSVKCRPSSLATKQFELNQMDSTRRKKSSSRVYSRRLAAAALANICRATTR